MKLLIALLALMPMAALAQITVPGQSVTASVPSQIIITGSQTTTTASHAVQCALPSQSVSSTATSVPSRAVSCTESAYAVSTKTAPPPAPTATLTAAPASILAGASSVLTWNCTNSTSASGVGTALSGTLNVTPANTTSYSETCTGSGGSATASATVTVTPISPPPGANCGNVLGGSVIFCDTFDAPAGKSGTRTGDLNPDVWGVSRAIGGGVNFGQSEYNQWPATTIQKCDGTAPTVNPPADVIICNGQLREASNDNVTGVFDYGDVTSLAMYPKQPFDFAGRTGTVSFDVSNDSQGIHAAWPEFWMSDLPVPDPFTHQGSWISLPANGFGIRLASVASPGQWGNCGNGNNLTKYRFTVDSAAVIRNYVLDDSQGYGTRSAMNVTQLDCVISASAVGQMNHVELKISQGQIDVYATDAGVAATPATLRHIAVVTNANLSFTRGLVWLEDVHYNADKMTDLLGISHSLSQAKHTFAWDNVAFDGPFTDRDFAFDAPDNTMPGQNGSVNLGQFSQANQTSTWSVAGLPANPQAAAARVLFNFNSEVRPNPTVLNVIVNGNAHSVPWPYPDQIIYSWRTFAVTIPLTDLVPGTNVVQLGSDVAEVFSNVDIVLADVTGGVPVLPGSNDAYP